MVRGLLYPGRMKPILQGFVLGLILVVASAPIGARAQEPAQPTDEITLQTMDIEHLHPKVFLKASGAERLLITGMSASLVGAELCVGILVFPAAAGTLILGVAATTAVTFASYIAGHYWQKWKARRQVSAGANVRRDATTRPSSGVDSGTIRGATAAGMAR